MTLLENEKIVLSVIEEYSGTTPLTDDEDILTKIKGCYAQAYQQVSQLKPIVKTSILDRSVIGTVKLYRSYAMPSDMRELVSVILQDATTKELLEPDYYIIDDNIFVNDESIGTYTLQYNAYPTLITSATADTFPLELKMDAQHLLAWKVADIILMTDPSADYKAFTNKFNEMLQSINPNKTSGMITIEQATLN